MSISSSSLSEEQSLRRALAVLAVTAGISIANIYYNQPLLTNIGESFTGEISWVGAVPVATQIGFALGMLLIAPLGDRVDRRRLVIWQAAGACSALLVAALAPTLAILVGASFMIGVFATMAQQAGPFAADLAPSARRGQAIGFVMSGLLLGILLARTLSGFVGEYFGWRVMFAAAIVAVFVMAMVVVRTLPASRPTSSLPYGKLLTSLWQLAAELPGLREAALTGASLFAAFSLFWSTLALFLAEPQFHLGPQAAGLFGIVGVVGALVAPWAGRLADRRGPRAAIWLAIALIGLSFLILWSGAAHIFGLVIGVIVLDAGLQVMQTPNQSRVFALRPEARSRLNTIYMVCFFLGGAIGSAVGAMVWQLFRWPGVCVAGIIFTLMAAMNHYRST
jgi:predicted MFS family arabinose efflux permease